METILQENVKEQWIKDMQIYAIATNRQQTVPDVKDSFKTVARRILTDMFIDKHLKYNGNRVKSAGPVGSTMEKYHPHCLSGDTVLCTVDFECITIEEAYTKGIEFLNIFAMDTENKSIVKTKAHSFRIGQYTNKEYNIVLSNNHTVKCTANHPFLTADNEWVVAGDLEVGTILSTQYVETSELLLYENRLMVSIVNIVITKVDNKPMYDFTVDKYQNMMIPVTHINEGYKYIPPNNNITMVCVHNSDTSIYDVICKMAAWWDCKIPLIDGHGNFGNMQGDRAAAMRYTEVKLSEFCCEAVIGDLAKSKDIVDWVPNFDESDMEPEFLPVKVPLLLINGTFGIGLGMRSEISRHNITEVIQAAIDVLKNPDAEVVLIPDHCMPCDIIDTNWKRISNTGFGTYRCRGRIDIETSPKGNPQLVIKSIPDTVTLFLSKGGTDKGVIADINNFIKAGKLPQIIDMKDDSKGNDLRYIIELRKGSNPNFVKEYLYKHTLLQKTFRVNFEVLDGVEPLRCSYKSYIEYFINFQIDLKYRTYYSLLQTAKTKWREKQLYVMVMESGEIRNIQDKIHKMKNVSAEAKNEFMEYLIKKFNVTDIEAQFIMNMDQMRTAIGYLDIYKKEIADYQVLIDEYLNKITNEDIIKAEIIDELEYFKKKYGRPRICRVIKDKEEDIPAGEFLIVITENNYIKKINVGDNINSFKGDTPKFVLKIDNRENLLLFNKAGKVFKLPVSKVDMCDKNSQGFDLRIMIKNYTSDTTTIMNEASVIKLASKRTKQFLVVLTSQGWIKKMDLDDFINVPPSGILYTKLNEDDFVRDITIVPNSVDVVVYSDKKALRFTMEDVNHYKRSSYGVISMNTKEPIDGLSVITKDSTYIVVISESGKINKFDATGLVCKKRNQAGSAVIKLGKTDKIHTIYGVNDSNILKIITKTGPIEVNVSDIPVGSSISGGTKYASNILKVSVI